MKSVILHEFDLQGKHYQIIDTLYFGEVSFIRKNGKHLIGLSERVKGLVGMDEAKYTEEVNAISNEVLNKADETDDTVRDALVRCYGMDVEQVKKLHYLEAGILFSELLRESTTPKKKLVLPSTSQSSSELPTTQQ